MDEVFGLFPTPFLRAPATLPEPLVSALAGHFSAQAQSANKQSGQLSHTAMLRPDDSPLLGDVATLITPKIVDMGALLFGQRLNWGIKEMWVNVLDAGGHQTMHNHANSFISGVIYLTAAHPEAQTVFLKSPGGTDFIFKNEHAHTATTAFNTDRWVGPPVQPGDVVLFPSYLLHAVPANHGGRRITLAFNAIPGGLDAWGYGVKFSA